MITFIIICDFMAIFALAMGLTDGIILALRLGEQWAEKRRTVKIPWWGDLLLAALAATGVLSGLGVIDLLTPASPQGPAALALAVSAMGMSFTLLIHSLWLLEVQGHHQPA